jgi:paraquat-inducible protein B
MSRKANPAAIGIFLIGAIILGVVAVATLVSISWFGEQATFVSDFEESVNGLEVGAAVKFQGVPVGQVTDLLIQIESSDKTFRVPVQYEVDLARLTSQDGSFLRLDDPQVLRQEIENGLRAQLQMESIVTGLLYVELAYRTDPPPAPVEPVGRRDPRIPTTPSLLAAFGTQAGSLVGDVLRILFRVNEMLEEVDMVEINRSVVASAGAVESFANSSDLQAALAGVPEATLRLNATMAEVQTLAEHLSAAVAPMQEQFAGANAEVMLTLQTLRQALDETRGFLSTDSGIGYQMEGAMASLQAAAEALRALAISLERNPDMLLRGRRPDGN